MFGFVWFLPRKNRVGVYPEVPSWAIFIIPQEMASTTKIVDKIDPYNKSVHRRSRRNEGSSHFAQKGSIELQAIAPLKGRPEDHFF